MLAPGKLTTALQPYWDDMEKCRQAKAFWSLLHVTICLPDICAALESRNGETKGKLYIDWCDKYLPNTELSGDERWTMRCKVLHQGRASTGKPGRYTGFAFGQPADTGSEDHMRVEASTLHLDVGKLAHETKLGIQAWIRVMEGDPGSPEAINVEKNLRSLVRVTLRTVAVASAAGTLVTSTFPKTN
jgi:hypothetical protein